MNFRQFVPLISASAAVIASASAQEMPAAPDQKVSADQGQKVATIEITSHVLGKGEARANSVIDKAVIEQQPAGLDPLKLLTRVPGLQVGSSDALTGSFSMRLSMRGLNKEQIGVSVDGIPNGSTLSNGGTMPNRLLETANVIRIDASQTAGDIGTPSNQALGGYIDFRTRDPATVRGTDVEVSTGNFGYQREFVRFDTGRFDNGISAYLDGSHEYVRTWPNAQSGRSVRDHADIRVLKDLGAGSSVRATLSYNKMSDNDYDAVALTALSAPFYKANFENNPTSDGLTDAWTGKPQIDQNNRKTRGIDSTEYFAHVDWIQKFGDSTTLTIKPYFHKQDGAGWFYVPYVQLPTNGVLYSAVAAGGAPVSTVQECYANQYQRTSSGALVPLSAVSLPTGASTLLTGGGCPAAAKYAMNSVDKWGAREATTRRGGYYTDRRGVLDELATRFGDTHSIRFGTWLERTDRTKARNWYAASDPTAGPGYSESGLYSTTQDRHYSSKTTMAYLQDKLHLLDDQLEVDLGGTYQRFNETYMSPVEFFGTRELTVSSGLLPKLAALYSLDDRWEVFASGSKNFSAIPDTVFEGVAAVDAKNGIKPETSVNKDVGIRWTKDNVGLAATLYSIDYRDRISIQNGNPNGDIFSRDAKTTFENQGGISSRGIELTARLAWNRTELYANYAYNDAHYVDDTPFEGIKSGDPVLGAARHNAFVELTWKPLDAWRLTANAKYVGKAAGTYGLVTNTTGNGGPALYPREYMPAYTLVGLSASYKLPGKLFGYFEKAELAVNIDNVFDEHYLAGVGAELTTSDPLKSGRYFLGSPRTLFATLRLHF
jgi:iron complex outermembrane recepter protein